MKKVKTAAALLCSACLVLSGTAVPTMADSVKVVTLGADLTQDQKNTMMKYFNVDSNQVQILTITNQDERDHLSAYVPLEQIGTRTDANASIPTTQPVLYQPMFAAHGKAKNEACLTFVSQAAMDENVKEKYGLEKL